MTLTRQLLAGSLALVALLVLAIVLLAGPRLSDSLADDTRAALTREARVVATQWTDRAQDAEVLATAAGQALTHRVTLIDGSGVVIGDSKFDRTELRALENHATRPEVMAARDSAVGCASRLSVSAGDEEMYCAVRHQFGFVRVAIQTATFRAIVSRAQEDVLIAGLIAMLGAVGLAFVFSRGVSRPIVELRNVAAAIAAGDVDKRPSLGARGEVGDLAAALHRMAEQLSARLHAIEREETLLLALIESLDEGIMAIDRRGSVIRLNAAARALLRIDDEPPFPDDRLPPERLLRDALRGAMQGHRFDDIELALHERTLALTARPLAGGGAVVALRDLTQQRRLETVRRDFVANVSHELRTPLTVIVGYAETLMDGALPAPERVAFAERILASATRLQRIVDDLLDLSRYESGAWKPQRADLDVESVVREVFTSFAPAAAARGTTLRAEIASGSGRVRVDPTAFRQILSNLVENAVRYTQDGSVMVLSRGDPDGRGVWIAVRDSGIGIAAEHLPRIFERFYRVDPGRSREAGGTGLGLSIVRHLVEAHGGEVRVESTPALGTTVSILLPDLARAT